MTRSSGRTRTIAYAIGTAALVLVIVAGVGFANSVSVTRVADNARSLHWTNATIGTAALTRAGLVQAVTFSELEALDVVGPTDVEYAMDQVSAAAEELQYLLDMGVDHPSRDELTLFVLPVAAAFDLLEDGDFQAAKTSLITDVEVAYVALVDALSAEQASIQASIEENSAAGRSLNGWIVFMLMLGVPGSAVAVYYVVARRQVRAFKERAQVELEAERTIGRAKDAFIAGLSHELRTPLTSIYGFAELIADGGVRGVEAMRETSRVIAAEAAEMGRMVDDLLAASRLESAGLAVEMVEAPVDDIVEAAVSMFERRGVEIQRDSSRLSVRTDPGRLRHVLVNLISNAVLHGGPNMGVLIHRMGASVDIEFWDDGAGVPEHMVERLFDRFIHDGAASLLTGSLGLGLAVASRIMQLMEGSIRYERTDGRTRFIVTLPGSESAEEADGIGDVVATLRRMSA